MSEILITDRLLLRPLQADDEAEIFLLRSDEHVNRYLDRQRATSMDDAREFISKIEKTVCGGLGYYWAVTLKAVPGLIGTICFWNISEDGRSAEIGYELMPVHEGKGYMLEALVAVINCAFKEFAFEEIHAGLEVENLRSVRVLERLGFEMVGVGKYHLRVSTFKS